MQADLPLPRWYSYWDAKKNGNPRPRLCQPAPPAPSQWLIDNEAQFMTLPRELRDQVYGYIVHFPQPLFGCSGTRSTIAYQNHLNYWTGIVNKYIGIFAHHPAIHDEALATFYRINTFKFDSPKRCLHWIAIIGPECAAEVRNLRVSLENTRVETAVKDPTRILAKSVEKLEVWHEFVDTVREAMPNLRRLELGETMNSRPWLTSTQGLVFYANLDACAAMWSAFSTHPSLAEICLYTPSGVQYGVERIDEICQLTGCEVRAYNAVNSWTEVDGRDTKLYRRVNMVDGELVVFHEIANRWERNRLEGVYPHYNPGGDDDHDDDL